MAEKPNAPRVMSGSRGLVYWEGTPLFDIKAFNAKVTVNREDVSFANELVSDSKMTGWKGEYTMTLHKVFSTAQSRFAQAIKEGRDIRTTIIGILDDKDAYGQERVALYNCWLNDLTLMDWENGSLAEEEIAGGFTDYEFIDTVERR